MSPRRFAFSSRNAYLSSDDRRRALVLHQSLELAAAEHAAGERSVEAIRRKMLARIETVGGVSVEYVAFVKEGTVEEISHIDGPITVAIAARVGRTRLIDNQRIG
jgi:pantoate--beta-alanine ligase